MDYKDFSESEDELSSRLRASDEENDDLRSIPSEEEKGIERENDSDKEFNIPSHKLQENEGEEEKDFESGEDDDEEEEEEEEEENGGEEENEEEESDNDDEEEEGDDEEEEENDDDDDDEKEEGKNGDDDNDEDSGDNENEKEDEDVEEKEIVVLRMNPQPLEALKALKDRNILKKLLSVFSWENTNKSLIALVVSNVIFLGIALCNFSIFTFACYCSFFATFACGAYIYSPIIYKKYAEGIQPKEGSNPGDALEKYSEWLAIPADIITEIIDFLGEVAVALLDIVDAAVFFRTSLVFSAQVAFCLVLVTILMSRFGLLIILWVVTDACFAGFPLYKENKKLVDEYANELYPILLQLVDKTKEWIKTH